MCNYPGIPPVITREFPGNYRGNWRLRQQYMFTLYSYIPDCLTIHNIYTLFIISICQYLYIFNLYMTFNTYIDTAPTIPIFVSSKFHGDHNTVTKLRLVRPQSALKIVVVVYTISISFVHYISYTYALYLSTILIIPSYYIYSNYRQHLLFL